MNISVFIIPIIIAGILSISQRKSREYHLILAISLFPLVICGLFRWEVGTDWPSYLSIFESVKNGQETIYEPGWVALNLVASMFGGFEYLIFITFSIILSLITICYVKYPFSISILFFLCFYRFGVFFTRIDLAAITFIALYSYRRQFFSLLALLFHKTLVMLPVFYYLLGFSFSKRTILLVLAFVICSIPFINEMQNLIMEQFYQTFLTHYEELAEQSVDLFKSSLKLLILLGLVVVSYYDGKSLKAHIAVAIFLIIIWCGENFVSQGLARLYSLTFPMLYFLIVPYWPTMKLSKRCAIVLLFILVFVGWAFSPFYAIHFPINLWFERYI